MATTNEVKHFFRKFRAHQMDVWANGGGVLTVFPSGRTEHSFGSAPFGEHALSAFVGAKRHVAFLNEMRAEAAAREKRRLRRRAA